MSNPHLVILNNYLLWKKYFIFFIKSKKLHSDL